MDVDVQFPSPTPFLRRSPPIHPAPIPVEALKRTNKRSAAATKKTAATVHTVQGGVISKPKQSKSRNGCITCKKKRLKCDEAKPGCQQCERRGVACEGYKKDFKWRQFEEATFVSKPGSRSKKVAAVSAPSSSKRFPPNAFTEDSPSDLSHSTSNPPDGFSPPFISPIEKGISANFAGVPGANLTSNVLSQDIPFVGQSPEFPPGATPPSFYLAQQQGQFDDRPLSDSMSEIPITGLGTVQYHESIVQNGLGLEENLCKQSAFKDQQVAILAQSVHANGGAEEEFDEEIPRDFCATSHMDDEAYPDSWSLRFGTPAHSESSSSRSTTPILYGQPTLRATSSEMLLQRFDQQTCGILSVKDGPSENPWRTLVWPLAHESRALRQAIKSMAALHGSRDSRDLLINGVDHMRKSMKELVSGMGEMRVDAALATTLALAFAESWDEHIKTGIQHLRGARALVNNAVVKHKADAQAGVLNLADAERLKFLCNTYIYMDVLARLTSLEETTNDMVADNFEEVMALVNGPLNLVNEVDPLLGCAYTLFPLIGRVANLVQRVRRSQSNTISIVSQATELKQLIQQWDVPNALLFERPDDPTSEVEHSIQTAEAYRWATLLYLHQAVPEIPSEPALVLAERILLFLARVPLSSRTTIVQIFPLLASSCEVVTREDRDWVRERWQAMIRRLQIRNVDKCLEVVEETWSRRDAYEASRAEQMYRRANARGPSSATFVPPTLGTGKRKAMSFETVDTDSAFAYQFQVDGQVTGQPNPAAKRRVTMDHMGRPVPFNLTETDSRSAANPTFSRRVSDLPVETIDYEYTARGSLHWLGVMRDHEWEGE